MLVLDFKFKPHICLFSEIKINKMEIVPIFKNKCAFKKFKTFIIYVLSPAL